MFCKILSENEELCKEFTELIIGRKIGAIVRNEKEKTIEISADGHGVRLDVYFEDDKSRVYDIEMLADRINTEVITAIRQDKWRMEYMSYLNAMLDSFEDGKREGIEQGVELINKLNTILISEGRYDDLSRSTKDKKYQEQLISELITTKAEAKE